MLVSAPTTGLNTATQHFYCSQTRSKSSLTECTICLCALDSPDVLHVGSTALHLDCFSSIFRLATSDESHFPPSLNNRPIPLAFARLHLPRDEFVAFKARACEWQTPVDKRLYCAAPACAHFIGCAGDEASRVRCGKCGKEKCARCRHAGHQTGCDDAEERRDAAALVAKFGYTACPSCKRLIEKATGCDHV